MKKLAIFIHWGVYSVPAYGNEWYALNMYDPAHREFVHYREIHDEHRGFGYKDFIPMFRGSPFRVDMPSWMKEIGEYFKG